MELVLTITAAIGALLFLIGYLAFMFAGFRHHFVTGIISALPLLNIVTIPALWHKTSKKLLLSIFGIGLVATSWLMGADANIKKILFPSSQNNQIVNQAPNISSPTLTIRKTSDIKAQMISPNSARQIPLQKNQTTTVRPFANQQHFIDESDMEILPPKALYKLTFENVPINKANTLNGRIVEITTNTQKRYEGKVTKVSTSSLFLQSGDATSVENEFPIANIKQLRLMVKKAIN